MAEGLSQTAGCLAVTRVMAKQAGCKTAAKLPLPNTKVLLPDREAPIPAAIAPRDYYEALGGAGDSGLKAIKMLFRALAPNPVTPAKAVDPLIEAG